MRTRLIANGMSKMKLVEFAAGIQSDTSIDLMIPDPLQAFIL